MLDEEAMKSYSLYPGVLTKGRKKEKVMTYLQYQIDHTEDSDWKLLWSLLAVMVEANGVINAERSKQTTNKICQLLISYSSAVEDLPPNEMEKPNETTYLTDILSVQELLLSGKVFIHSFIHSFI